MSKYTPFVFLAGLLAGSALTAAGVPRAGYRYLQRRGPVAPIVQPAAPNGPTVAAKPGSARSSFTMKFDEGGTVRDCTDASAELLDPSSSAPRIIVWATCDGQRLSVVATPERLPGKPRVHSVRLTKLETGEEWASTQASLDVTELGEVGGVVAGEIDAQMSYV